VGHEIPANGLDGAEGGCGIVPSGVDLDRVILGEVALYVIGVKGGAIKGVDPGCLTGFDELIKQCVSEGLLEPRYLR